MFAAQEPASKFIVAAHRAPKFLHDARLEQAVEDFLDILQNRLAHKPIAEVCESLRERAFDLRVEAARWLSDERGTLQEMLRQHVEKIEATARQSSQHHLVQATHRSFRQYEKIIAPYLSSQLARLGSEIGREKPDYATITMLGLHPEPRVRFIKNWLDSSLDLEVCWIAADLVLLQEIESPAQPMVDFLEKSIVRFGAYSMFTGFWSPADPNEDALTSQSKILAATLELDFGTKNKRVSPETFHQMLQN